MAHRRKGHGPCFLVEGACLVSQTLLAAAGRSPLLRTALNSCYGPEQLVERGPEPPFRGSELRKSERRLIAWLMKGLSPSQAERFRTEAHARKRQAGLTGSDDLPMSELMGDSRLNKGC